MPPTRSAHAYGEDVSFTTLPSIYSTTTPATNAGTGADVTGTGTGDWINPGYITADDTNYASVTLTGSTNFHYLEGTNYGFAIPANATINGILVTIGRYESGTRLWQFRCPRQRCQTDEGRCCYRQQ